MKKNMNIGLISLCFSLFFMFTISAQATTIVGKWKTIDDNTHEQKSIVEIYEKDGEYYGQIKSLFQKQGEDPNPVCDKCKDGDSRKNQPIIGMKIIQNLKQKGNEYSEGTILDPDNGKVYKCKLWVEDGKLRVRGYIAFLFRTQTWLPVE